MKIVIPDLGFVTDWIIVAYTDAATMKIDNPFSVAGHIVFLLNKKTNNVVPLTWSSKKIERVVNSSLGAEVIAGTKLIGTLYFIKEILKQMYGTKIGDIPCLLLTDSKDLYEAIHNIKSPEEKRLIGDIFQLKQAIALDRIITEVRHVPKEDMLADPLTKGGRNAEELLRVIRSGVLNVPGGSEISSSTRINSSSWKKLLEAQTESLQSMTTLGQ